MAKCVAFPAARADLHLPKVLFPFHAAWSHRGVFAPPAKTDGKVTFSLRIWSRRPGDIMKRKAYEKELVKLQRELCLLQDWVVHKGLRVVVIFEGRDAAGKGGMIKAITERV